MKVTENLIKLNRTGKIPIKPVAIKHREENLPRLQVPQRTALTSARKICWFLEERQSRNPIVYDTQC